MIYNISRGQRYPGVIRFAQSRQRLSSWIYLHDKAFVHLFTWWDLYDTALAQHIQTANVEI